MTRFGALYLCYDGWATSTYYRLRGEVQGDVRPNPIAVTHRRGITATARAALRPLGVLVAEASEPPPRPGKGVFSLAIGDVQTRYQEAGSSPVGGALVPDDPEVHVGLVLTLKLNGDPEEMIWAVVHEAGHGFGEDHTGHGCPDPSPTWMSPAGYQKRWDGQQIARVRQRLGTAPDEPFVAHLCAGWLGRLPTQADYTAQLGADLSTIDLERSVALSAESFTAGDYVGRVYRNLLGRNPEAAVWAGVAALQRTRPGDWPAVLYDLVESSPERLAQAGKG
jgi:hypothetical protein